jgi:hypothetical protein
MMYEVYTRQVRGALARLRLHGYTVIVGGDPNLGTSQRAKGS